MEFSTTVFDLAPLLRLRRAAACAAELPQELPEGWHPSPVNPVKLLKAFPPLKLRVGYVLEAWVYRSPGGDGNGVIYAVPESLLGGRPVFHGPFERILPPPGGVLDFMTLIEGDLAPWSYLSASLLVREVVEFGAQWHGCGWSTHQLLGNDPWREPRPKELEEGHEWPSGDESQWTWQEPRPTEWRPTVSLSEDLVTVTFHSYSALGREQILQHTDSYCPGGYRCQSIQSTIATGHGGYIF